jgi:hypothetical protein
MRTYSHWNGLACLIGLALWGGATARAQFQPPQDAREYEDSGTLEEVQGTYIKFRDSKNDVWLLETNDGTKVTVTGDADHEYLHSPALHVQITGQIDKKGVLQKEIEEIEICADPGKAALGLFVPAAGDAPAKPVRSAAAGTFLIKGRVISYKDGQLVVIAGNRKIIGKLGDGVAVSLNVDDPSLAQPGDTVKVKAWYYDKGRPVAAFNQPGQALAEEVKITLVKPLAYTGKKPRTTEKASKSGAKSSRLSK